MNTAIQTPQDKIDAIVVSSEAKKDGLSEELRRYSTDIQAALPRGMTADQFIRVALTGINKNRLLRSCGFYSILQSCYEAAALGLPLDGILGYAYLIPYEVRGNWQAQLQIGYRGYCALAYRNTDRVVSLEARVVHDGDAFSYRYGTDSGIDHRETDEPGELTHAYAVCQVVHGGKLFTVLPRSAIEKRRATSQAYRSAVEVIDDPKAEPWKKDRAKKTPWIAWEEEMWRKTAIRALVPTLPLSTDAMRALIEDERRDMGLAIPPAHPGRATDAAETAREE